MEQLQLNSYLKKLKEKKPTARSYFESRIIPYLQEYNWDNKTFFKDMQGFWVGIYSFLKKNNEYQLFNLLEWSKGKNLHPKQIIKVLLK